MHDPKGRATRSKFVIGSTIQDTKRLCERNPILPETKHEKIAPHTRAEGGSA